MRGCCASLLTSLNAIMNMPCGSRAQHPQPAARPQPHAAPPPAAAFAIANSASPTNSSSNASEHSSSYYHRPPRLSNNGTFEGVEHNSSSGYGSSAEAQVRCYSLHELMIHEYIGNERAKLHPSEGVLRCRSMHIRLCMPAAWVLHCSKLKKLSFILFLGRALSGVWTSTAIPSSSCVIRISTSSSASPARSQSLSPIALSHVAPSSSATCYVCDVGHSIIRMP